MSRPEFPQQALLTFGDAEKSPLSIRAKALVFVDPRSRQLREQANALAGADLPVLIVGETGTGKELLARHIHRESERGGLFVVGGKDALLDLENFHVVHGVLLINWYTVSANILTSCQKIRNRLI